MTIPDECRELYLAQRSEPKTAGAYAAACLYDFEAMKPYLVPGDVLDIGCGLATTSVLIQRHCGGHLHLLDGTGNGKRWANYGATMQPYNDRALTELMLRSNGVTDFTWHDVGATALPPVDVVVSLISWGWHYPVQAYLKAVAAALRPGGRLILDLRERTRGELALRPYFTATAKYKGFGKSNKTVWTRR